MDEITAGVADMLDHSAVIVVREVEMANVLIGFEQQNRYTIRNTAGAVIGHVVEDDGGFGGVLSRQFLRRRRRFAFTATDTEGNVLFRCVRPIKWLINSKILVENNAGDVVGEVRQRWHPVKRKYDMYLGKDQFAAISGNFLAWEFELLDSEGRTLAMIDRNWSSFGVELFTDAGKYVLHFGRKTEEGQEEERRALAGAGGRAAALAPGAPGEAPSLFGSIQRPGVDVSAVAKMRTGVQLAEASTDTIVVVRLRSRPRSTRPPPSN